MKVRKPHKSESIVFAEIHLLSFKDFFLSDLGISFLNTYYKSVIEDHSSITICVENENGEIIGFATGNKESKGYNKRLFLKNILKFSFHAFVMLLKNKKNLIRLIRNFEKKENPIDDGKYAELSSIAVLPDYKGLGIGKQLLNEFEREVRKHGGSKICLTTDSENNLVVNRFYQNSGYELFYEFNTFPNRKMFKYVKFL